jgi:hypothetical protein
MKYREQKDNYEASMETVAEFDDYDSFLRYLNDKRYERPITSVRFQFYMYDERNGWNTYYVLAENNKGDYIPGFSDSALTEPIQETIHVQSVISE